MKTLRFATMAIPLWVLLAVPLGATVLQGQTDYYNLDRGRPTRIEDALTTELYALGVKLAPLRIEQDEDGSLSRWLLLPEIAYGILPGTSIEVGAPIVFLADGATGMRGLELSVFHNLNVETTTLPALAVRGELELPVGSLSPDRVIPSLAAIATRTLPLARFHLNARYSFDGSDEEEVPGHEEGRWLAGIAVDRAFPLRALLLIGEVYAVGRGADGEDTRWTASGGTRYQVNPYLTLDGGVSRTFSGAPGWHITLGGSVHFGIRALVRGAR